MLFNIILNQRTQESTTPFQNHHFLSRLTFSSVSVIAQTIVWSALQSHIMCSSRKSFSWLSSHDSFFILIVLGFIPHWILSPGSERLFPLFESQLHPRLKLLAAVRKCKGIDFLILSNLELSFVFFPHNGFWVKKKKVSADFNLSWRIVQEWMDEFNNTWRAFVVCLLSWVPNGPGIIGEAVVLRLGERDPLPPRGQARWEMCSGAWRPVAEGVGWTSPRESPGWAWGSSGREEGRMWALATRPQSPSSPPGFSTRHSRDPRYFQGLPKYFNFF